MSTRVLITGGAGFIGSHVADEMLRSGYDVRGLDILSEQVHGPGQKRPDYLDPQVELIVGDVRDPETVRQALNDVDIVFHFVANVGVGQSMYRIADYVSTNNYGTAVLLEALADRAIGRLVVASSMSIYGEGLYKSTDGQMYQNVERPASQLKAGLWEVRNSRGDVLLPIPTPETKAPRIASIYALSKYDQERMCLMVGQAYDIPAVALRFFNAYGPRQALSNPYTGVLAIFASRLLNDNPPLVYEDGNQQRDFVSVHDVARACRLAAESPNAVGKVYNIAGGRHYRIKDVAALISKKLGKNIEPLISGKYRVGDIRHCFADISLARTEMGYNPQVELEEGIGELAEWLEQQTADDRVAEANEELAKRGLSL